MISIPTTDILTPNRPDADKAVLDDRPNKAESSFLGIINADNSGADERDDTFGVVLNASIGRKVDMSDFPTVNSDNVLLSIQQDTVLPVPSLKNVTKDKDTNNTPVLDDKEILLETMPDAGGRHRILPADLAMVNPLGFATNQGANGFKAMPYVGEEEGRLQVEKKSPIVPGSPVQSHSKPQQSNSTLPTFDVQTGQIESPKATLLPLGGETAPLPQRASYFQSQTLFNNANSQTLIDSDQPLKLETEVLGKTASAQQIENLGQPIFKATTQEDQGPLKHATNAEQSALQPRTNTQTPITVIASESSIPVPITNGRALTAELESPLAKPSASRPRMPSTETLSNHPKVPTPLQPEKQSIDTEPRLPLYEQRIPAPPVVPTRQPQAQLVLSGPDNAPKSETVIPLIPEGLDHYGHDPKTSSRLVERKPVTPITIQVLPSTKLLAPDNLLLNAALKGKAAEIAQPHSIPDASAMLVPNPSFLDKAVTPLINSPLLIAKDDSPPFIQPISSIKSGSKIEASANSFSTTIQSPETSKSAPQTAAPEIAQMDTAEPLEAFEFATLETRGVDVAIPTRNVSNLNRPEIMRHVAQQLTEAARQMQDRPVELALNPEELGRVRLTFTTTETSIHVAVVAERGETLDIMRRHIETLAQDFRDLGYRDVKFEFSGNGAQNHSNRSRNNQTDPESAANPEAHLPEIPDPIKLSLEPPTRLDLRL